MPLTVAAILVTISELAQSRKMAATLNQWLSPRSRGVFQVTEGAGKGRDLFEQTGSLGVPEMGILPGQCSALKSPPCHLA